MSKQTKARALVDEYYVFPLFISHEAGGKLRPDGLKIISREEEERRERLGIISVCWYQILFRNQSKRRNSLPPFVTGFQFTLKNGYDEPLVVKKATGGRSADLGLSVQNGKNGIVLGYSLTGTRIPPSEVGGKHHEYILTNLELLHPVPSTMQLCLKEVILAGKASDKLVLWSFFLLLLFWVFRCV